MGDPGLLETIVIVGGACILWDEMDKIQINEENKLVAMSKSRGRNAPSSKLTDGANKERIVKSINRHRLAVDLSQKFNCQGILDILQVDATLNMRRAVSNERLDHGALVIWIAGGFGNVGTEPGPDKVGGIGWVRRSAASKMMSSISGGLIASLLDAHVQTWREKSRNGDGRSKLEEHDLM